MDKYDSRLAKFVGWINRAPGGYAITLGQTTYYSVSEALVAIDHRWQRHENRHKAQWKEEGYIKFFFKYVWYSIRYGYTNNPYEIDARKYE